MKKGKKPEPVTVAEGQMWTGPGDDLIVLEVKGENVFCTTFLRRVTEGARLKIPLSSFGTKYAYKGLEKDLNW